MSETGSMNGTRPGGEGSRPAAAPARSGPSAGSGVSAASSALPGGSAFPLLGDGGPIVPDVERIAVLRGGGLGDLVFALPALDALRAAYPAAEIVLLGQAWAAPFLAARESPVDRVMPLPVARGVHEPSGAPEDAEDLDAFFDAAAAEAFDIAIQIHGGGRHSNPFVRRLGARVTAGLRSPEAEPLDRSVPYVYYQSEVLRTLEVVSLVGAPPVRLEPRIALSDDDVAQANACVPAGGGPIAILHPGAGDPRRRWPLGSFAAVGEALVANGARVLVTGIPGEAALTRSLADMIGTGAVDLGGQLAIGGLAGLLARADVVVSNDSGPLHLASAVGATTVGIFWCGNLINAGPFSRSRHHPVISWRLECPACGVDCTKARCDHIESFVADAPVDEARDAALRFIGVEPAQAVDRARGRRRATSRTAA